MRKILFRGKQHHNNKWAFGDINQNTQLSKVYMSGESSETLGGISHTRWDVIPETVGQYTGLKDKNGTEIYEGDVLKTPAAALPDVYNYTYVEYRSNIASYVRRTNDKAAYTRLEIRIDECEVIGNIHDNPELLKPKS